MKTLKLIVLMLVASNFIFAQTTWYGANAGQGGSNNAHYGPEAGRYDTGSDNVYIGRRSGRNATTGKTNVGIGYATLFKSKGQNNTVIGYVSGFNNETGWDNVFMGAHSGKGNISGSSNIYLGATAGIANTNGQGNVAIGRAAGGSLTTGGYNVFIGYNAGNGLPTANNRLYIHSTHPNTDPNQLSNPLIYGEFDNRKVGINTSYVPDSYTLAVNGKAIIEEIQVMKRADWPDYVFAEDYKLMSLTDLETEIETLGHLPGVPSAEEVETNGHALGRMDAILLEKIEELTLHLIDINKEVKTLQEENAALKSEQRSKKGKKNKRNR